MQLSFVAARAVLPGMQVSHQGMSIVVHTVTQGGTAGSPCCTLVGNTAEGVEHSFTFQEQSAVQLLRPVVLSKGGYTPISMAALSVLETINLTGGVTVIDSLPVGLEADPDWLDLATAAQDLQQALWGDGVLEACLLCREVSLDDDDDDDGM